MAILPKLSQAIQRKLDLVLKPLRLEPKELVLPDPLRVDGTRRTGYAFVSYQKAIADNLIERTCHISTRRFEEIAKIYFDLWASDEKGRMETLAQWIGLVKASVLSEIAATWATSQWDPAFQRRCLTAADQALMSGVAIWEDRARISEIQRLDHSFLRPESNPNSPDIRAVKMPLAKMFEIWIQPVKVRLRREQISPEEALEEVRSIANDENCPVTVRARILEQLDLLSETSSKFEDSTAAGFREGFRHASENIRREAAAMFLDLLMAPAATGDYYAAKSYAEQTEGAHGRSIDPSTDSSISSQPPIDKESRSQIKPSKRPNAESALAVKRQAVVMPLLDAKGWTRGKWGTEAGVGKNGPYEYLSGERRLSPPNRKAMAEVLGLKPEDLPE